MSPDLQRCTIFVTLAGSQAHGTARAGSDIDLRGVCLVPLEQRLSLFHRCEQVDGPLPGQLGGAVEAAIRRHPTAVAGLAEKSECIVYELAKFLTLCTAANPNALEILFAAEEDWLFCTPAWLRVHAERRMFLTRKARDTYLGYGLAQLKRIKTHRAWLLHPPERKPVRRDFGLPDAPTLGADDRDTIEMAIADRIRSYGIDDLDLPKSARIALQGRLNAFWCDTLAAAEEKLDDALRDTAVAALDLPSHVAHALAAERRYRAALRHWESYTAWKEERNPTRAELERRHGYDTKHAMHLLRLMRCGLEILEQGELLVRRPDAKELNEVRDGRFSFDEILAHAADLENRMKIAADKCCLPTEVDPEAVDRLYRELARMAD